MALKGQSLFFCIDKSLLWIRQLETLKAHGFEVWKTGWPVPTFTIQCYLLQGRNQIFFEGGFSNFFLYRTLYVFLEKP